VLIVEGIVMEVAVTVRPPVGRDTMAWPAGKVRLLTALAVVALKRGVLMEPVAGRRRVVPTLIPSAVIPVPVMPAVPATVRLLCTEKRARGERRLPRIFILLPTKNVPVFVETLPRAKKLEPVERVFLEKKEPVASAAA
jgi:hypothetical protein